MVIMTARDQTNSVRHTTTPGVSFSPAGHAAVSILPQQLAEHNAHSPAGLLQKARPRHTNGFVETDLEAYNHHRARIIRPSADDVWLAILTQINFFVNGNAELLRSQFVAHEGKDHSSSMS